MKAHVMAFFDWIDNSGPMLDVAIVGGLMLLALVMMCWPQRRL